MSLTEFLILLTSFLVIASSVEAADISLQADNGVAASTFANDSTLSASAQEPLCTGLEISNDLVRSVSNEGTAPESTAFHSPATDLTSYVAFAPLTQNFYSDLKF